MTCGRSSNATLTTRVFPDSLPTGLSPRPTTPPFRRQRWRLCAGYRVVGQGHHQVSFEATELTIGVRVSALVAYFELCRRKRNTLDYDVANVVSDTEASELLRKAREFKQEVETWIAGNHASLVP
jgi:hypothetical protein